MKIILGALLIFCAAWLMIRLQAASGSDSNTGCAGVSADSGTGKCTDTGQITGTEDKK